MEPHEPSTDRPLGWRGWLSVNSRRIVAVGLVLGFAGLVFVWNMNANRVQGDLIATCTILYQRAQSHSDTVLIDARVPIEPGDGTSSPTCGTLRRAGRLPASQDTTPPDRSDADSTPQF